MKGKLPIIGLVRTGKDAIFPTTSEAPTDVTKASPTLGGLFEFAVGKLSDEKSASSKLLKANKDWVYKNNDVIAKEVSKIEFELFKVGFKGGEITYTPIDEHPLLDLLDRFNETTTRADGLYNTQSHRKLVGDAFWLLDRNGRTVQNIFLLPPDKITLDISSPVGKNAKLVKSYTYEDVIDGKKIKEVYRPEDVLHFKVPNPDNPFRGYGAVEAAADTIDTDNLTNQTQTNFFRRGAVTNFVLTTDKNLTNEQIKALEARMRSKHTGLINQFRLMLLGNGLKPTNITYSNKDMQLLEFMEWYRDKLMVVFGNTKASLGIIDDVNRASHESSVTEWKRSTVKSEADGIVNTLNEFLVPLFGDNLLLGYKSLVPEDRSGKVSEAKDLKNAGIISLNEAREEVGYEPVEGGDELQPAKDPATDNEEDDKQDSKKHMRRGKAVDQRFKDLGDVPQSLRHLDVRGMLRRRKVFTQKRVYQESIEAVKPVVRAMLAAKGAKKTVQPPTKPMHAQFNDEVVTDYYQKQIHVVEVIERRFRDEVEHFIQTVVTAALHNLDTEISSRTTAKKLQRMAKKDLFNEEELRKQAQLDLTPLLVDQLVLAGQEAYRLIGVDDVYLPYKLRETVRENVDKFTASLLDTDKEVLGNVISEGIEQGRSVVEIRADIESKFAQYTKMQAERITRTEVLRASNLAAEDAFQQSGVVEAKQWLVAPGADANCQAYSGKIVRLGASFYESDDKFANGNPPVHPNCRCVLLPIVIDTKLYEPDLRPAIESQQKRIAELEAQFSDKDAALKELRANRHDDQLYIKSLEKHLRISDAE